MKFKVAQSWPTLWLHGLYSPWNSLGQNTGVGSLSLLQEIFPTQGLNRSLLHGRQILYQLSHKGNPRLLGWVAYHFSSRSSQPRNWTGISCIAGRFFTNWAIRAAPVIKEGSVFDQALGISKSGWKTRFIADHWESWVELGQLTIGITENFLLPLVYLLLEIIIFADFFFRKKCFISLLVLF